MLFSYLCNSAAISEESMPPLNKAAIGRSVINLFRTAIVNPSRIAYEAN